MEWVEAKQLSQIYPIKKSKIYLDVSLESIPDKNWGIKRQGTKPKIIFNLHLIELWLADGCPLNKDNKALIAYNKSIGKKQGKEPNE